MLGKLGGTLIPPIFWNLALFLHHFIVFTGLIVLILSSGIRQGHPYLTIREKLTVSLSTNCQFASLRDSLDHFSSLLRLVDARCDIGLCDDSNNLIVIVHDGDAPHLILFHRVECLL
jgi:hypothetical protein